MMNDSKVRVNGLPFPVCPVCGEATCEASEHTLIETEAECIYRDALRQVLMMIDSPRKTLDKGEMKDIVVSAWDRGNMAWSRVNGR